jgi:hypothetical protein
MRFHSRRILGLFGAAVLATAVLPGLVFSAPAQAANASHPGSRFLQLTKEFNTATASPTASVNINVQLLQPGSTPNAAAVPFPADGDSGNIQIAFDVESTYGDGVVDRGKPDGTCVVLVGDSSCATPFRVSSNDKKGTAVIRAWIDTDGLSASEGGITEADAKEGRVSNNNDATDASSNDCLPSEPNTCDGTATPGDTAEPDKTDVGLVGFGDAVSDTLRCTSKQSGRGGSAAAPVAFGLGEDVTITCRAATTAGAALVGVPIDGELLKADGHNGGPNDSDQEKTDAQNTTSDYQSTSVKDTGGAFDAGCVTDASGACDWVVPGRFAGNSSADPRPPEAGVARLCFWVKPIDPNPSPTSASGNPYTPSGNVNAGGGCGGTPTSLKTSLAFIVWQEAVGLDAAAETATVDKGDVIAVSARVYDPNGAPSVGAPKPTVYAELFSGSAGDVDGSTPNTPDYTFPAIAAGASTTTVTFPANTTGTVTICIWTASFPAMSGVSGGTGANAPTCTGTAGAEGPTDPTNDNGVPSAYNDNTDVVVRTVKTPDAPPPPVEPTRSTGYWILEQSGRVTPFDVLDYGSGGLSAKAVGIAARPQGDGFWIVGVDGSVAAKGQAKNFGSATSLNLQQPIVGIAAAPGGDGYWLLGRDGGIFSYGPGAKFWGSTGGMRLNKPVVGIAATPTGNGYWLVASDGGIFAFGDAPFAGSMGGKTLNKPVVGMTAPVTGGYLLVASDGGMFVFGGAHFYGSMGGQPLARPIVGMTSRSDGEGYWEVADDGGIFAFHAGFHRSLAGQADSPVAGMASYGNG